MDKLFTVAGTSNLNGVVKFRFANDLKGRVKVLAKNGHTDIRLIALPEAMTKEAAMAFLEGMESDTVDVDTLRAELAADGELADDMTDEFLAEVAARENGK
jgi:anion-transporting  ArsA/GET3 family ATPase